MGGEQLVIQTKQAPQIQVQTSTTIAKLQATVKEKLANLPKPTNPDQQKQYDRIKSNGEALLKMSPDQSMTNDYRTLFDNFNWDSIDYEFKTTPLKKGVDQIVSRENTVAAAVVVGLNNGYNAEDVTKNTENLSGNALTAQLTTNLFNLGGQTLVDEWLRELAILDNLMKQWGSGKGPSKDAFGKTIEHVLNARVLDNVTKRARSAETAKRSQESYAAGKKNFEEKNYFMVTLVPKKGGETTKEEDGETKAS